MNERLKAQKAGLLDPVHTYPTWGAQRYSSDTTFEDFVRRIASFNDRNLKWRQARRSHGLTFADPPASKLDNLTPEPDDGI